MANATITVKVGGASTEFELLDLDFDESRAKFAQRIGEAIVDTIYREVEG